MKKLSLRTFIQNLYSLWVYDYHMTDLEARFRLDVLEKWGKLQKQLSYYNGELSNSPEIQFIKNAVSPQMNLYPYKKIKDISSIDVQYDSTLKMPYVLHEGKRLYYPKSYTCEKCESSYRFVIAYDQILGGGYLEKAPHCYQTSAFKVEEGDVLVDCGAAEGLFSLDVIDRVSHAFLIEADAVWLPALQATFAPYKDKVTIIPKYLSDKNDKHNVTLATLLANHTESCFIKMDIEGAEKQVVKCSMDFLKSRENVRLVCCTYHYQHDAEELSELFEAIGYKYTFSDGYLLFALYDNLEPPYLRHVLIRAQKQ